MSPAAAFHTQLASIMEVLANTAVAEICELVDSGYSVLQLEISRSRKENEVLRRKLRLMELRAARASALRVVSSAGSAALLLSGGRARAPPPGHRPGNEARRFRTPEGEVVPSSVAPQKTGPCSGTEPPSNSGGDSSQETIATAEPDVLTTPVIKVEDADESWSTSERDKFCQVIEGQLTEAQAPHLTIKQEVEEDGSTSQSWTSSDVSSTSATNRRSESGATVGYECLMYEPQLQRSEDPGCSYALTTNAATSPDSGGSFPFVGSKASAFQDSQQRALLPADEPVRKDTPERHSSFIRRGGWRPQDRVARAGSHEDAKGKSFVCNCCGKTLACLKNLKTHMRVHTGEKPFVCALCGKRFSDSSNLKRHQSVHTGEKRYGCVHCGKRFAQSGSLKVHMTVHTDCKQFRCSYCGKTFISGSHLRRHVTVHAGEKRFGTTFQ
ncbi:uncharacterized protein ACBR49_011390 [Aulostomus maculatus]